MPNGQVGTGHRAIMFKAWIDDKDFRRALRAIKSELYGLTGAAGITGSKMATAFAVIGTAVAIAGGAITSFMVQNAMLAGRVQELEIVLKSMTEKMGYSKKQVDDLIDTMISYGISYRTARRSLLRFVQAQMKLEDAAKLARVSQNLAVIAGEDSSSTFERLTLAVAKCNVRMLHTFGILTTNIQAWTAHANILGKTVAELTVVEKRQAVLNAIFKETETMTGAYTTAMGTYAKKWRTISERMVEDLKVDLGQVLMPVLDAVISTVYDLMLTWRELTDEQKSTYGSAIMLVGVFTSVWGTMAMGVGVLAKILPLLTNFVSGIRTATVMIGTMEVSLLGLTALITGLAIVFTAFIALWYKQKKAQYENSQAMKESIGLLRDYERALEALEQKQKEGIMLTEKEIHEKVLLILKLEDEKKAMQELEKAYLDLHEIYVKHGVAISDVTYFRSEEMKSFATNELYGLIKAIKEEQGERFNLIGTMDLLETKYKKEMVMKAAQRFAIEDTERSRRAHNRVMQEEIQIQEELNEAIKEAQPDILTMKYKDFIGVRIDSLKVSDDLVEKETEIKELVDKLKKGIYGNTVVVTKATDAADKYSNAIDGVTRKELALINAKQQKITATHTAYEKTKKIELATKAYNQALEKEAHWHQNLDGIYKTTFATDEEKLKMITELNIAIWERRKLGEELIEIAEDEATMMMMQEEGLMRIATASETATEALTTIPEVISFGIEHNLPEFKDKVEALEELLNTLSPFSLALDVEGAVLSADQVILRIGQLADILGDEYVIKLVLATVQEEKDFIDEKIRNLKARISEKEEEYKLPLRAKLDMEDVPKELEILKSELTKWQQQKAIIIKFDTDLEVQGAIDKYNEEIKGLADEDLKPEVDPVLDAAYRKITTFRQYASKDIKVNVIPSVTGISGVSSYIQRLIRAAVGGGEQYGMIATKPTFGVFGEAGAEALIPLTKKSIYPTIRGMQETLGLFQQGGIFGSWKGKVKKKDEQPSIMVEGDLIIQSSAKDIEQLKAEIIEETNRKLGKGI